jgi:hypothetical protein
VRRPPGRRIPGGSRPETERWKKWDHEPRRLKQTVGESLNTRTPVKGAATMTKSHHAERTRGQLLRDAALTLATILLAAAAFDDITTDRATTFTVEWAGLAVCGVSLCIVCWRVLRNDAWWLGAISSVVLIAAVGAGSQIRPGTGPDAIESLTTAAGLLWFLALTAVLAGQAWRRTDRHVA